MQKLFTPAGEALRGVPWNACLRPQIVRKDRLCLNGKQWLCSSTRKPIKDGGFGYDRHTP